MRYLVTIQSVGNEYHGHIRSDEWGAPFDLPRIQLGEDAKVKIKDYARTLGELVESLVHHRVESLEYDLDEPGQLAVGQYLYAQTFGRLPAAEQARLRRDAGLEVRIVTADEHIARLPWALLADNGVFLTANGWSLALSSRDTYADCILPPSPKILLVMPEPAHSPTGAQKHLEDIVQKLSSANNLHTLGRNLKVAYTWEQFEQSVREFEPHVIYYYGHGSGDFNASSLLFVTGEGREPVEKPVIDVAQRLRNAPGRPPHLVYLNCCQGDTGGLLGAGRQLGSFVPAVISNCTRAHVETAQKQGLTLLQSVLVDAVAPHVALAEMRRDLGLSFSNVRWMTTVLHCHYNDWRAERPRPRNRIERDPDWHLKLNRAEQFNGVHSPTLQMLSAPAPRTLAYIWYGQEGQGVELFNQRVKVALQRHCTAVKVYFREVNVEWPLATADFSSSMESMLTSAFEVSALDEIPSLINAGMAGVAGRTSLFYIRARPLSPVAVHARMIKKYMMWWNAKLVPLLISSNSYALIGLPFLVENLKEFKDSLSAEEVDKWEFSHTRCSVLKEMGNLVSRDIVQYLLDYEMYELPPSRNRAIESILEETGGKYELVMGRIRDIEPMAWNLMN